MYFNFLKGQVINWNLNDETNVNWKNATDKFVLVSTLSDEDIVSQEKRLAPYGYQFPEQLKAFWKEFGCGYLCPNDALDNGFEKPSTAVDIYLSEGEWAKVKLSFDLFVQNELPFFQIGHLDYITIGIEEGVNLGKVYRLGEEIAPNLVEFVQRILQNPSYYNEVCNLCTK